MTRFFCEDIRLGQVVLDPTEAHHLIHVLRLRPGDAVEVMNGRGVVGQGVVLQTGRKSAVIDIRRVVEGALRRTGRLVIATSIPKGPRLDTLITQCTELAADHIALTVFERTVKQPQGQNFAERCRRLAVAAAKQCGRPFLPTLSGPETLPYTLAALTGQYSGARILFGRRDEEAIPIDQFESGGADVIAFVGPEGGMTADEERLLEEHGAVGVRLGEHTLRIETAAIAFCAICGALR